MLKVALLSVAAVIALHVAARAQDGTNASQNAFDVHAAQSAGQSPSTVAGANGGNQQGNGPGVNSGGGNGIGQGIGGGQGHK
jgi:hypothetical protein